MTAVTAKSIDGGQTTIDEGQIKEFKAGFQGMVLLHEDEGYDKAREIWNGIFDRKPAIIARCVGSSNVINAVNFARNYWKSHHLKELSDDCIDKILEFAARLPTDECEVFIPHMEGAPSRVPETETAFAHRTAPFVLNIHTRWRKEKDDDRCLNWAKEIHSATQPFPQGVYVNFLSEGENRAKEAYTPRVWNRLVEVKRNWDPQNLFRINQNIKP
jgi:hypothetical protein